MTNVNKLRALIKETVTDMLSEDSEAAKEAHAHGLTYASFGRWKDKTGRVVAKSHEGKLVYTSGGAKYDLPKDYKPPVDKPTPKHVPDYSLDGDEDTETKGAKSIDADTETKEAKSIDATNEFHKLLTTDLYPHQISSLVDNEASNFISNLGYDIHDADEDDVVKEFTDQMEAKVDALTDLHDKLDTRYRKDPSNKTISKMWDRINTVRDSYDATLKNGDFDSIVRHEIDNAKQVPDDDDDFAYDSRKNGDYDD